MTKSDAIPFLRAAIELSREAPVKWSARDRQAVQILINRTETLESVLQDIREILEKHKNGTLFKEQDYTQCEGSYYALLRIWKELSDVFPVDPELIDKANKYTRTEKGI